MLARTTFLFALLFTFLLASTAPAADAKGPRKPGQRPGGPSPELKAKLLEKFDANKNGTLDPEEMQAAKAAFMKRQAEGGGKGFGGKPGEGKPGQPGGKGDFLKRFDKNGDGKIDDGEKQAAKEAFGKRKAEQK